MKHALLRRLLLLARPEMIHFLLPLVMALLVIGTISQRSIGIYQSQKLFFSSFIVWFGPLPLPGMLSVLLLLGMGLLVKLLFKSPWRKAAIGTLIVHLGALLLLAGGLLTAVTAKEGSMVLSPDSGAAHFEDYHFREFTVERNGEPVAVLPFDELKQGQVITSKAIPFRIRIDMLCRHCEPSQREEVTQSQRGMAQKIELHPAPLKVEDEENQAGMEFTIEGASESADGVYFTYAPVPHPPELQLGDDSYRFKLRKKNYPLPFTVTLERFQKQTYPGTDMAKEFESIVTITDGAVSWQSPIRMNEPLRYRGYTLYQAAFSEAGEETLSILAVVHNAGRAFPYIASIVMCIGLLIHLWLKRSKASL